VRGRFRRGECQSVCIVFEDIPSMVKAVPSMVEAVPSMVKAVLQQRVERPLTNPVFQ
jgi:hypothetical protein